MANVASDIEVKVATRFGDDSGSKTGVAYSHCRSVDEFLRLFPHQKELLIDGIEGRTQRSSPAKTQRKHYSGKQGCHRRKNIAMVNPEKKILLLAPPRRGVITTRNALIKKAPFDVFRLTERFGWTKEFTATIKT